MTIRRGQSRLAGAELLRVGRSASDVRVDVHASGNAIGFLAATRSGATGLAAFTNGLLIHPFSVAPASETLTTTIAAVPVATTGIKFTLVFQLRFARRETWRYPLRCRVRWEVTAISGAGGTGRVNVDLQRNGVALTGLVKASGPTRSLEAIATFTEANLVLSLAGLDAPPTFEVNDTLDLRVEFEVMGTSIGASPTIRVHHDPADVGGRLTLDTDWTP